MCVGTKIEPLMWCVFKEKLVLCVETDLHCIAAQYVHSSAPCADSSFSRVCLHGVSLTRLKT